MPADELTDARIIDSWRKNAAPWTAAVREQRIESRRLVTDAAIVDAVAGCSPRSVLDLGCGEGWLARALAERGARVVGVDVVPELVAEAQRLGGASFRRLAYEEVIAGALAERFDAVVCNFSLLGKETVDGLIGAVPSLLNEGGSLVIQTLHPTAACGDEPYEDGWRAGSWAGFDATFTDPAPWYFRTLGGWERLFAESGLRLREKREPVHPVSGEPASILFLAEVAG